MHNIKYNFLFLIKKNGTCVMKGARTSDNFYEITSESGITCNSAKLHKTKLWHQILGHINFDDLSKLFSSKLIHGIPKLRKITSCVCESCQLKNKIKSTHKKFKHIATTWTYPYRSDWPHSYKEYWRKKIYFCGCG